MQAQQAREFGCKQCGRRFTTAPALADHQREKEHSGGGQQVHHNHFSSSSSSSSAEEEGQQEQREHVRRYLNFHIIQM